jgi:thymidylate kinase
VTSATPLAIDETRAALGDDVPRALRALLERLERSTPYLVLRDREQLDELRDGGEVDILVDPAHLATVGAAAAAAGFVALNAWGHGPHTFFVHYDTDRDCWIKCDVHTSVSYGRPVPHLGTDLKDACLAGRVRRGGVAIPCPEDALVTLLLHCILDKQQFQARRVARVKEVRWHIADHRRVQAHLSQYWPWMTWPQLAAAIDHGRWDVLLADRPRLVAHLRQRDRFGSLVRRVRNPTLQKLQRLVGLVVPRGLSVALLAPDGAGKSTLVTSLRERPWFTAVHSVYMGLYQRTVAGSRPTRVPGLGLLRSLVTQWRRYGLARRHLAAGRFVIFDRYTYDALLPTARPGGLAGRLRRWALAHACPAPDLVVVLDVAGEVLFARKGERAPSALEQQRHAYGELGRRLRHGVVVDASCDAEQVRRRVTALMWERYRAKHGAGPAAGAANPVHADRQMAGGVGNGR